MSQNRSRYNRVPVNFYSQSFTFTIDVHNSGTDKGTDTGTGTLTVNGNLYDR